MKRNSVLLTIAATFLLAAGKVTADERFSLQSRSIQADQSIELQHYWNNGGCSGGNVMPDLDWKNVPAGTQSFAVTFYDKDAPTGSGFWHWVLYDIAASTTRLEGGSNGGQLPDGAVEGNTDLGKPGFLGPCPPLGRKHNYVYTVHALKVDKLPLERGASPAMVGFYIWQNSLGQARRCPAEWCKS